MEKVAVGMSGGVDSSVAAALLVEQGYDVTGMMLKLWVDECGPGSNACCTPDAMNQAKYVAQKLNIPFYVIDAKEEFKSAVVDYFLEGHRSGVTPNPCYMCNRYIRWGFLLNKVLSMGFDYFATGHYARVVQNKSHPARLLKGLDSNKDQSYILSGLSQEQLLHTILPLGDYSKTRVRELASGYQLEVAQKPDSQDLCFVEKNQLTGFIEKHRPGISKSGVIRLISGEIIGHHEGLFNYTIGQRKGLGSGFAEPLYVISKDLSRNELIVGYQSELGITKLLLDSINWISGEEPNLPERFEVKIRYKSSPKWAELDWLGNQQLVVKFEEKIRDATPGQFAVFYEGENVVGGGVISNVNGETI